MGRNKLKSVPGFVCGLRALDTADFSRNAIVALPDDMAGLAATELNLNQNQVRDTSCRKRPVLIGTAFV